MLPPQLRTYNYKPPERRVHPTVIVGGGPAGLATAIMLARRGWRDIHVYDRLPPPPAADDAAAWTDSARFYLLGLGGRGQNALRALGAWEEVSHYCTAVVGRRDWSPEADEAEGVERIFTDRTYSTQVIARDRLVGALLNVLRKEHADAVAVHHGFECTDVEWTEAEDVATVTFAQHDHNLIPRQASGAPVFEDGDARPARRRRPETLEVTTPFLVGADGTARSIARGIEVESDDFEVVRYKDDNPRVYKTVPLRVPEGWRGDINYSARTKDGRINFDALPSSRDGDYCGVLLLKRGDPLARANTEPADLRALLDESLPQFSRLLSDEVVAQVAAKPPSRLPAFRFARPRLHHGSSTLLLGDAVHTVKPYFGLGANSAFEDVVVLGEALDGAAVGARTAASVAGLRERGRADKQDAAQLRKALVAFSRKRAPEAAALVRMSRGLDRPGALGFVTFILPLILDGVFHAKFPKLFQPNTIALLQKEYWTFTAVAKRKRADRAAQVAILGAGLAAMVCAVQACLRVALATSVGRAVLAAVCAAAFLAAARKAMPFLVPGLSPGDVLAKTQGPGAGGAVAGGRARGGSNEDFLMTQRMSQAGYGEEPAPATAPVTSQPPPSGAAGQ